MLEYVPNRLFRGQIYHCRSASQPVAAEILFLLSIGEDYIANARFQRCYRNE